MQTADITDFQMRIIKEIFVCGQETNGAKTVDEMRKDNMSVSTARELAARFGDVTPRQVGGAMAWLVRKDLVYRDQKPLSARRYGADHPHANQRQVWLTDRGLNLLEAVRATHTDTADEKQLSGYVVLQPGQAVFGYGGTPEIAYMDAINNDANMPSLEDLPRNYRDAPSGDGLMVLIDASEAVERGYTVDTAA